MHALIDMASSPEYLAPGVHNTETIDIDIDPAITGVPNGSCSSIPPSTVSYSTPDPNSYSEVSHISPFDTSPVIDERLLTPVSSAASPLLQQRAASCRLSPFEQHPHPHPDESAAQQPTPPHTTAMYSYPDYLGGSVSQAATAAASSMALPAGTGAEPAQHDHHHPQHQQHHSHHLLPFLHHPSPPPPHHDDNAPPPPPQANPYFGSYTVSMPPQDHEQYYLPHTGDMGPLGLLRHDVHGGDEGGAYTHRPLAPLAPHAAASPSSLFDAAHHPHHQPPPPPYHHRLPRLSPAQSRQYAVPRARRDRTRKASARGGSNASSSSRHHQHQHLPRGSFSPSMVGAYDDGVGVRHHHAEDEDDEPDQEVTLDDKTPAELRRLWDTRRKWLDKKGNGMWEDIMLEYLGEEYLTENKKTQVKAALQMKIHRMLLKHGKWPERDEAALLRAYKRWEERRYVEILRLYEEEMAGSKKAYEWRSQHIEVQLVKMGLEEPERDRDSKARKRKQIAARHHARTAGAPLHTPPRLVAPPPHHRLPGMYDQGASYGHYAPPHYEQQQQQQQQQQHQRAPSYDAAFAEQIGAQPPALSEEQNERLAREILERNPFADNGSEDGDDVDVDTKMELSDYGSSTQHRSRAASLIPGVANMGPSAPSQQHTHHPTATTPEINAQRSAAVARQACGEMLKQQHFGSGVGA